MSYLSGITYIEMASKLAVIEVIDLKDETIFFFLFSVLTIAMSEFQIEY